jgi:predicted ATPase
MAVRFVERQNALRKLTLRDYTSTMVNATIDTTSFGRKSLKFAKGLTVLTGGNGAGKSTTLGALWKCLNGASGEDAARNALNVPSWLREVSIDGRYQSKNWKATYKVSPEGFTGDCPAPVDFIDAARETGDLLSLYRSDNALDDLLEGLDPGKFDGQMLELLSYVLRRHYSEVLVFEVTSFSEDDDPIPFFQVTSMGHTYDLLRMGRGELCATYLLWRLNSAEPGTVIFLEEPESHLANWSQRALADVLTRLIVDKDLTVIASSHSPGFFSHLPAESTVLLASSPAPEVRCDLPSQELARYLGLQVAPSVLLVVEDFNAALFCRALLRRVDQSLLPMVAIKYAGSGESGVRTLVRELRGAASMRDFPILGVLDGDQRPAGGGQGSGFGYLSGSVAPESQIRDVLFQWRAGAHADWVVSLDGGSMRLKMTLERLDGHDHHDWLHELGVEYGGRDKVVDAVTEVVLQDDASVRQASALAQWIRENGRIND